MATWEEGTLVYPGFNFLQNLLGHLISSKRLDFPLASLAMTSPGLSRWRSITHATSPHAPGWTMCGQTDIRPELV